MTKRNGLLSTLATAVVGAVVATLVVSCGIRPSVVIHGQGAPQGTVTSLIVYLVDHDTLRAVNRPLPPTSTPPPRDTATIYTPYPNAQDAINALMAGPTASEAAGGLTSELPSNGAAGYVLSGEGGVYQVFIKTGDGTGLSQRAVDQVVCTVSASFISNGRQPGDNAVRVQVLDVSNQKRSAQTCPATP